MPIAISIGIGHSPKFSHERLDSGEYPIPGPVSFLLAVRWRSGEPPDRTGPDRTTPDRKFRWPHPWTFLTTAKAFERFQKWPCFWVRSVWYLKLTPYSSQNWLPGFPIFQQSLRGKPFLKM
eukprot:UN10212